MLERIFSFDTLWWVLMVLYVPACVGLIVIVLLQKGKGTGFAGAFGAGAGPGADTVFGPRMSRSLPIRLTYAAAALFMIIAVVMSLIAGRVGKGLAPELVEDAVDAPHAAASNALTALGLGTNKPNAERSIAPEVPAVVDTPQAEEPTAETAPTAAVEAQPPAEGPAPASEAPAVEAPDAKAAPAEEAPVSQ